MDTPPSWHSDPGRSVARRLALRWPRDLDGAAHRPLRADHAPGRAARRARRTGARSSSSSPRRLPEGRRYGVVAGVGRALDAIEEFRFDDAALAVLRDGEVVDDADPRLAGRLPVLRRHLGLRRGRGLLPVLPAGDRRGHASPRRCVLETVLLSIYNHDSAIASAASRMTLAAGDRPCIEMGSRRTHEEAAVAAPGRRTSPGFATTSNLAARPALRRPDRRHQRAHASRCCTTPRRTRSGPRSTSLGVGTTLLVDTYDIAEAVRLGVEIAGPELGAVRLDSGDLGVLAREVRAQLDRSARPAPGSWSPATSTSTRSPRCAPRPSTATASAPSWSPAAATRPAASSTSWSPARTTPATMVSVAKKSVDKISIGGRKFALRRRNAGRRRRGRGGRHRRAARGRRRRPRAARPAGPRRRGRRPRAARRRPRAAPAPRAPSCPLAARQMSKGEPVIDDHPPRRAEPMALLTCDFFSEALEVGTSMTVVLPQPTEGRSASSRRRRADGPPRCSTCCTGSPTTTPRGCATPRSSGTPRRPAWRS